MNESQSYFIKTGYTANPLGNKTLESDGNIYWTEERQAASMLFQYYVYSHARRLIRRFRIDHVVDVGCGTAFKARDLLYPVAKRLACLDQPSTCTYCRQNHKDTRIEFYPIDFDTGSVPSDLRSQFQLIVCADVIEHLEYPNRLLTQIRDLSQPGALAILSTPERDILRGKDVMSCTKLEHVREWNSAEFCAYLSSQGFQVIQHKLMWSKRIAISRPLPKYIRRVLRERLLSRSCQVAICRID